MPRIYRAIVVGYAGGERESLKLKSFQACLPCGEHFPRRFSENRAIVRILADVFYCLTDRTGQFCRGWRIAFRIK